MRDRGSGSGAPPSTVIRGRSADNRKAPLNFSFPLEGKCHVVAKGCTRVSIPMKLTIVLLGPTSADLETLCRVSTKRRISVRVVSDAIGRNYQSAGRCGRGCAFLYSRRGLRPLAAEGRMASIGPNGPWCQGLWLPVGGGGEKGRFSIGKALFPMEWSGIQWNEKPLGFLAYNLWFQL